MGGTNERWDCLFVDRIDKEGKIFLRKPQEFGYIYIDVNGKPSSEFKVRKSIPKSVGNITGESNEKKILKAIAIMTTLNKNKLLSSSGLILRAFKGETPFPGLQTAKQEVLGQGLRIQGSTGWIAYISPDIKYYSVVNNRYLGEELSNEQTGIISECVNVIETKGF